MSNQTLNAAAASARINYWAYQLERLTLIIGCIFLVIFVLARVSGALTSRIALYAFDTENKSAPETQNSGITPSGIPVDFSLWSAKRIREFKANLPFLQTIAVLNIPRLKLAAPIFQGTDDLTLNQGLGRIIGTAELGQDGNTGIAGHRDGFFRPLKDIARGDSIEIALPGEKDLYVVDQTEIVEPDDVSVLQPRSEPGITLVTCYPFYFVGDAPHRFIVKASLRRRTILEKSPNPGAFISHIQKEQ